MDDNTVGVDGVRGEERRMITLLVWTVLGPLRGETDDNTVGVDGVRATERRDGPAGPHPPRGLSSAVGDRGRRRRHAGCHGTLPTGSEGRSEASDL